VARVEAIEALVAHLLEVRRDVVGALAGLDVGNRHLQQLGARVAEQPGERRVGVAETSRRVGGNEAVVGVGA
jgi:hypothetical protein